MVLWGFIFSGVFLVIQNKRLLSGYLHSFHKGIKIHSKQVFIVPFKVHIQICWLTFTSAQGNFLFFIFSFLDVFFRSELFCLNTEESHILWFHLPLAKIRYHFTKFSFQKHFCFGWEHWLFYSEKWLFYIFKNFYWIISQQLV